MFRKVLLAIVIVGTSLAAGVSLAGASPLPHLIAATPVLRAASVTGEHDGPTMFLVGIGLMAVIARRRYH